VFKTLTGDGVETEKWPHAWCEEDDEYARIQHGRMIDRLDNEIEDAEAHLATLKHERDRNQPQRSQLAAIRRSRRAPPSVSLPS
jgi:septal ring factor EnvC (AmiA/AmiB activator)